MSSKSLIHFDGSERCFEHLCLLNVNFVIVLEHTVAYRLTVRLQGWLLWCCYVVARVFWVVTKVLLGGC